jgi:hypothetical protein
MGRPEDNEAEVGPREMSYEYIRKSIFPGIAVTPRLQLTHT